MNTNNEARPPFPPFTPEIVEAAGRHSMRHFLRLDALTV